MKTRIVEKKFVNCSLSNHQQLKSFKQVQTSLRAFQQVSSIYSVAEAFHTLESELKDKSHTFTENHYSSTQLNQAVNQSMNYSQNLEYFVQEESLFLINKMVNLFTSKQHITSHIANSLAVRGFQAGKAKEIGKIVTNSFGQYICLAETIKDQLKIAKIQQRNIYQDKERYSDVFEESKKIIKKQKMSLMNSLQKFEIKVYQKLAQHQQRLLGLSSFRNKLILGNKSQFCNIQMNKESKSCQTQRDDSSVYSIDVVAAKNLQNRIRETENQIKKLSQLLVQSTQQLQLQKRLYDQMLEKNLQLQKQLYFAKAQSGSFGQTSSFRLEDQLDRNPQNIRSPSFQDDFN